MFLPYFVLLADVIEFPMYFSIFPSFMVLGYRRDVLTTGETFDGELIFTRPRMKAAL